MKTLLKTILVGTFLFAGVAHAGEYRCTATDKDGASFIGTSVVQFLAENRALTSCGWTIMNKRRCAIQNCLYVGGFFNVDPNTSTEKLDAEEQEYIQVHGLDQHVQKAQE